MPKVLRILNRFNLGGPTFNATYLSKYLSPEYETILIGGLRDETEENSDFIARQLGVHKLIIPEMRRSLNINNDIRAYKKISDIICKFKPDIVHTHAAKAGALGRLAAHRNNVPVIVHTFHGHVFDAYFSQFSSWFYKTIERRLAKISDKIIAISENQKFDLVEKYRICDEEKVVIVPLGFDLSRFQENMTEKRIAFRKQYLIDDDEIAIGIVGRLVPIKNHQLFIDAIKLVLQKIDNSKKIRVFIVGDGESRKSIEKRLIQHNIDFVDFRGSNLRAPVTFTSWIKEVDCVMAGMDIIALTSLNEGTPVSLIEAQAANKPIVTTDVGGIFNVVIPNKTALLSESNNVLSFADNLYKLIVDENLRNQLSMLGWNHVRDKYHYTRLVNDMKRLYNSLLEKKK